jgi:hypothetical protein
VLHLDISVNNTTRSIVRETNANIIAMRTSEVLFAEFSGVGESSDVCRDGEISCYGIRNDSVGKVTGLHDRHLIYARPPLGPTQTLCIGFVPRALVWWIKAAGSVAFSPRWLSFPPPFTVMLYSHVVLSQCCIVCWLWIWMDVGRNDLALLPGAVTEFVCRYSENKWNFCSN